MEISRKDVLINYFYLFPESRNLRLNSNRCEIKTKQTKMPKTFKLFSQNQSGCPLNETGAAVEMSNFKPFCADCIPTVVMMRIKSAELQE